MFCAALSSAAICPTAPEVADQMPVLIAWPVRASGGPAAENSERVRPEPVACARRPPTEAAADELLTRALVGSLTLASGAAHDPPKYERLQMAPVSLNTKQDARARCR